MALLEKWSPHNRLVTLMFVSQALAIAGVWYYWNPVWLLATAVGVFLFASLGLECYLHRYLSHASYKVSKPMEAFLHMCGVFALQGPPMLWAANHITHHKYADVEGDPHPATAGWRSWLWVGTNTNSTMSVGTIKRLLRDPLCVLTKEHYFKIYLGVLLFSAAIDPRITVYFFMIPAAWSFHASGFVTVMLHRHGYRNFETKDLSRNMKLAGLFLGSPLHNNHHANPGRYNDAVNKGEVDLHGLLIHHVLRKL